VEDYSVTEVMSGRGLQCGSILLRVSSCETATGRDLVEFACQRVELIQLAVVSDNEQARRLYQRLGLKYGIEKKALKQDGRYYDEVLMAKDLKPD
jgi:ribosomal protein S18 acetylase RimI-like enzyme